MNHSGVTDHESPNRITSLFIVNLGYTYLGNWAEIDNSNNIEEHLLSHYLSKQGYSVTQSGKAIQELKQMINSFSDDLYEKNKKVYSLLRQGIPIKENATSTATVVKLIDWENAENNSFGIAEEVSIKGSKHKRQDLVIYVNGIALGVLELKAGVEDISQGVKQAILSQQGHFPASFFSTVQLVMAGNDKQGLRYGTVKTEEKFFQRWNEAIDEHEGSQLEKYLGKFCTKQRFLELIYEGVIFDGGRKKLAAAHHYFALKAAQASIRRKEGGMIWHPQGSGKGVMMVLLAKWILENKPNARILVLSDKTELVEQLEGMSNEIQVPTKRAASGKKLLQQLKQPSPRLLFSLVQKLGKKTEDDVEDFLQEIEASPMAAENEIYVFVDECHRTQSGKLHLNMKSMLMNAVFMGFTEAPLLKKDKKIILEVFGDYVHTYKLNEVVEDEMLLR